ncbi:hypothetical protein ASG43_05915 [Aureimonas sp. Leaf454]|uniref:YicC/YloC family endoribonuclease n=1 Tax=Aureimonas sp. Leaf454 TaxID=1736381 RepID=UPI0006F4592A|nr:YicC/YloC family endoribonuclease [Aureimonas sp. Leaf454]KQT50799.1 hypothetical protein ASG43_05915 [Aureimonas sp. Leaf454]
MPVASMTGFARIEGEADGTAFVWEIRSVNGKGLDLRLRLPPGYEAAETELRKLAGARLSRGNLQVSLSIRRSETLPSFAVNEVMLADVLALSDRLIAAGHAVTPTADGILALKGIIEPVQEAALSPDAEASRRTIALAAFPQALDALEASRWTEGAALRTVLGDRLAEIGALANRAEHEPSRRPDAIRASLATQLAELMDAAPRLDEARLHQEVALLATKVDIREELDRLRTHVAAAEKLLVDGGPIGRRLDFLSQEFNRESNTICSKSNSADLTAIGLDLKVVVDQFREQVQNIE